MEKKMAKIGDEGGATVDEILSALLKSPKTGGVPGKVMELFTAMMDQLGAVQETAMRDMRAEHNAAISDMKAEHDVKMERLLRMIDRMAKEGDAEHDPLEEFRGGRDVTWGGGALERSIDTKEFLALPGRIMP